MISFLRDFFIDGFAPGDYQYGFINGISLAVLLLSIVYFSIRYQGQDVPALFRKFRPLAVLTLAVYLGNRFLDVAMGSRFLDSLWPFYLCNINTIGLTLVVIFGKTKHNDFWIVTGCIGGFFPFVFESGIFSDRYWTFNVFESVLSHFFIVFVPAVLVLTKAVRLHIRDAWIPLLGLLATVFNAEVLQEAVFHRFYDYSLFRRPFPFTIEGVPQFLITSALALMFLVAFYLADMAYLRRTPQPFRVNPESSAIQK